MPRIKVNDINIYYEVYGEGFPLVMIQGLSANIDWYNPELIDKLSGNFKTIIFDNRGAGRTDSPDNDLTIEMMARDTAYLMDALNISRAHIYGISMGGMIAQELTLNYPEKVEKLILCSTTCGWKKGILPSNKIINILRTDKKGIDSKLIAKGTIPLLFTTKFVKENREYINNFINNMLKAPITETNFKRQLEAADNFDTYDRLNTIKKPTLVLHGKEDILIPHKNSEILARMIPRANLKLFDQAGHEIFQPNPNSVIDEIISFLEI